MIRISWMLVSYLAAATVILAGPDQPEQPIDTERSFVTVHVGKTGVLSAAAHTLDATARALYEPSAKPAGSTLISDLSFPRCSISLRASGRSGFLADGRYFFRSSSEVSIGVGA